MTPLKQMVRELDGSGPQGCTRKLFPLVNRILHSHGRSAVNVSINDEVVIFKVATSVAEQEHAPEAQEQEQ